MKEPSHVTTYTRQASVSLDRIDAFAELPRDRQLDILTSLRGRSVEDHLELAMFGILLPIVISVSLSFTKIEPLEGPWWVKSIIMLALGLLLAVPVVTIVGVPLILRDIKRKNALVWLAAYEDELARRRGMSGRVARRWQKIH